jgi:2-polyprenyl-6-methoxyphenol hydroxylase-like FAD-dependent oxidoreductase
MAIIKKVKVKSPCFFSHRPLSSGRPLLTLENLTKAIIIGAGPAGLAAAIRLKTHNAVEVSLYEIRSEPTTLGGAVNIVPNGLRLFDRLGLLDKLKAQASSAQSLQLHSLRGSVLLDVDLGKWSRDKIGYGFMRVLRADLVKLLHLHAESYDIPVHFGKKMVSITETDTEVTVAFSDGTKDSADLVLGCDGIHSAVRTLHVNPTAVPEYSGIANMFTILPTSRLTEKNRIIAPALHATLTPSGMFGLMPCTASGDHLYWFYSREVPPPEGGNQEGWQVFGAEQVQNFKENLLGLVQANRSDWVDQLSEIIQRTDTIKFYPIYKMQVTGAWGSKRCLLLGDAAHAMPPHAGQGTSMALEDVFLLSRLLETSEHTIAELIKEFENVRRPRVETTATKSVDNGDVRRNTSPWALWMRECVIGFGFWIYKATGLYNLGVGMSPKEHIYDIMDEPIWLKRDVKQQLM